jgi:hypothetical protein
VILFSRVLVPFRSSPSAPDSSPTSSPAQWALAYILLYVLATFRDGRSDACCSGRHPAGWVFGAVVGTGSVPRILGGDCTGRAVGQTFVSAWLVLCGVLGCSRAAANAPAVDLPVWSTPDTRTLRTAVAAGAAVFVFPYKNLGARDATATVLSRLLHRRFIWHIGLTAELTKYAMPPSILRRRPAPFSTTGPTFWVPAVISEKAPADCA